MTTVADAPTVNPYAPAVIQDHQSDQQLREEERAKNRKTLRKCLDPVVAKSFEARKPLYEFEVTAVYDRPNEKGRLVEHSQKNKVIAQNEADAWAMFCDLLGGELLSPKNCERTIKKLGKING